MKKIRRNLAPTRGSQAASNSLETKTDEGVVSRKANNIPRVQTKLQVSSPEETQESIKEQIHKYKGLGFSLPKDVKEFMESKLGASFDKVRIHTGEYAVRLNEQLNSLAFTHGYDIFFNKNRFDTSSVQGRKLLVHELTHVVQHNV